MFRPIFIRQLRAGARYAEHAIVVADHVDRCGLGKSAVLEVEVKQLSSHCRYATMRHLVSKHLLQGHADDKFGSLRIRDIFNTH